MPILTLESEPLATSVSFSEDIFRVALNDGREISVPLAWFPRLLHATPEQRGHWELIGLGANGFLELTIRSKRLLSGSKSE